MKVKKINQNIAVWSVMGILTIILTVDIFTFRSSAASDDCAGVGDSSPTSYSLDDSEISKNLNDAGASSEANHTIVYDDAEVQAYDATREVIIDSGECGAEGDNLTWKIVEEEDGYALYIEGSGRMKDYYFNYEANENWHKDYRERIKILYLSNGITHIGDHAFYNCSGFIGNLTIPDSVTSIGSGAFWGCGGFTGNLAIPNSVTSIGKNAFRGCEGFTGNLTMPFATDNQAADPVQSFPGRS